MSHRILGVGVGVFIITCLWIGAIFLAVLFSKVKRPISFLGCGSIVLAFTVTVILLCIPRKSDYFEPEPDLLPPDYLFIWRSALLVFLFVSLVAAVVFLITEHWAVPVFAKPLKKVAPRNTVFLGDSSD